MSSDLRSQTSFARVFAVAWPMVAANCSTPLLGLVDTAVIGNSGSAARLGAIAFGTLIFSFIYWGFGFLRMGTTGFVSQAYGAADPREVTGSLMRALVMGAVFGTALVLLQWPVGRSAMMLLSGSKDVEDLALTYFQIRIWSAPATLCMFGFVGWLIGLQKTRTALALQLIMNAINIVLDVVFVTVFHWGVRGVAAGTVLAEYTAVAVGFLLVAGLMRRHGYRFRALDRAQLLDPHKLARLFSVNGDIFIRTLCLLLVFAWFTSASAQYGDTVLGANHILLQLISFSAFFLDGYAFAAESLVGWAVGARSRPALLQVVRTSTAMAGVTAAGLTLVLLVFGALFVDGLTNVAAVRAVGLDMLPWCAAVPILSVWCFQLDGIFIGATRTRDMRNMALITLALFAACALALTRFYGVYGLWTAFLLFYVFRGATLGACLPGLLRQAVAAKKGA